MARVTPYSHRGKKYLKIVADFTNQAGTRIMRSKTTWQGERLTNPKKALKAAHEFEIQIKAKIERDYSQLFFDEFHEHYLSSKKRIYRASTMHQYNGDLKKWLSKGFPNKPLKKIEKSDIESFIFDVMANYNATPCTQKKVLKTLRTMFELAVDEGLMNRNPTRGIVIKVPKPKKLALNSTEAQTLLDQAKLREHEFYFLWSIALLTGMRSGELRALRWNDIDLITGNIHISKSLSNKDGYKTTKTEDDRVFPISDDLRSLLLELKSRGSFQSEVRVRQNNGEFKKQLIQDFVLPRLTRWNNGEQARVTRDFCNVIGIKEVKFHDLRSTFITNLFAQGCTLPSVMALVGHEDMKTTNEYLRLSGVTLKGESSQLGYSLPQFSNIDVLSLRR